MSDPIKPRNTVKIIKRKVLDAYFAKKESEKVYETKTKVHIVGTTSKSSSLSAIAKEYKGVSWKDIQKENKMGKSTAIHPKQKLNITSKVFKGEKVTFDESQDTANLGDEVYVIVKTDNIQGKIVGINVAQGIKKGIVEKEKAIWLQQNGKDVLFPKVKVGEFAKNNKNIINKDYFKDLAVIKIKLRPKDEKKKKEYNDALEKLNDKKTKLFLLIDAHSENDITVIYNGRNPDKDGEPDDRTTPNYWLDMDGKWFELKYGCGIKITPEILKNIFPNSKEKRRKEVAKAINKYKCEFEINNIDRMAHFLGQIGTETAELNKLKEDYNYSAKTIYNIFLRPVLISHPTKTGKWTFKYHDLIDGYDATLDCEYNNPSTNQQKNYGHKRDVTNPIVIKKRITVDKRLVASWTYAEFKKSYTIKSEYVKSKTLFDYVYGCRMDNGKKSTKDGSDYFGVGFIHMTGKNKYKALDKKWNELYQDNKKDFMGDDISLLKTDVDVAMKASMIIWKHVQKDTNSKADKGNKDTAITAVTKDVNGGTNGLVDRKKYTKKAYKVLNKVKK